MSNIIADLRKELGLTQTELALACGLTRPLISAVETDRHTPSVKAALAIARALGTSVEDLFGDRAPEQEQRPALGEVPEGEVNVSAVQVGDTLSYHPIANAGSGWERADGRPKAHELQVGPGDHHADGELRGVRGGGRQGQHVDGDPPGTDWLPWAPCVC